MAALEPLKPTETSLPFDRTFKCRAVRSLANMALRLIRPFFFPNSLRGFLGSEAEPSGFCWRAIRFDWLFRKACPIFRPSCLRACGERLAISAVNFA